MKKNRSLFSGFALTIVFLLIVLLFPSSFDNLDNWILSSWYRIRGERSADSSILVVYFGNDDISTLGGIPIKRSYYALLVQALHELDANVIGIDIAFTEPDAEHPEYDKTLATTIHNAENVVLSNYFRHLSKSNMLEEHVPVKLLSQGRTMHTLYSGKDLQKPFQELYVAATGCGHTNLTDELAVPLLVKVNDHAVPAFFVEVLRVARGMKGDEISIPTDSRGLVRPSFCGNSNSFKTMSVLSLLRAYDSLKQGLTPAINLGSLRGKSILIGIIAEGRSTTFETPYSKNFPPILLQANLLHNALREDWLRTVPTWFHASLLLLIGIGFSLLTKLPPTIRNGILSAVLLMLPLAGGYALFVSLTLFLPMSSMLILGGSIIIVQFIFYHQTVRSELNAITTQLQEKEKHLQLLEHNAKREHTASEMQVLRSEIEKNQKEISHLKERLEDLQPYNPNSSSVRMVESFHGIVYYNNGPIAQTVETIKKIADHDSPVLILGESGTGKELVARALHASSTRREQPFVAVNCGALSETLLESELFGHERGAFTGAIKEKPGRFELANNGTIFLDEITETSEAFQVKLLRVLQEGTFERVGGMETKKVNVRVLAATNRNIKRALEDKKLREDIYYRLNVFTVELPSLRDRGDDIALLGNYFISQESSRLVISKTVMSIFQEYEWRGNVRELQSIIKRAVVLAKAEGRTIIRVKDLPEEIVELSSYLQDIEQQVVECLREKKFSRSSITETAEELGGINRGTVAEYFRGYCFKKFAECGWNIERTTEIIVGGDSNEEAIEKARKKLLEYLHNAVELVDAQQSLKDNLSISKPKYKNLPQKYHEYLTAVITAYSEKQWSTTQEEQDEEN